MKYLALLLLVGCAGVPSTVINTGGYEETRQWNQKANDDFSRQQQWQDQQLEQMRRQNDRMNRATGTQ